MEKNNLNLKDVYYYLVFFLLKRINNIDKKNLKLKKKVRNEKRKEKQKQRSNHKKGGKIFIAFS